MNLDEKIVLLKSLHKQILRYAGFSVLSLMIWILNGGGYLWPVWVMLIWGSDLLYQAYQLNLLKTARKYTDRILDTLERKNRDKLEDDQLKPENDHSKEQSNKKE